ncbi:MAG TPA: glycosyltransferase 87 family protein [Anaerolineae bacterium]|nr:glycosyltransferase 87 family protein [Anaerolineae bacterium]
MIRDRPLWLLLAAALGVRLLVMPLPDPFDADLTTFWLPWMTYGAEHGLAQLYQSGQPLVNYPPLYLTLLVGLGKLYGLLIPSFEYTPLQSALVKLPAVAADLAITLLLYTAARQVVRQPITTKKAVPPTVIAGRAADEAISRPGSEIASPQTARSDDGAQTARNDDGAQTARNDGGFPLLAAGLWALNPAIIYVSAYWAQVDSIHTLWMLAALLAALGRRWGWSGLLMGLALLTKLHAIVLLPLLLALAWRDGRRAVAWGALGLGGTLALGLLPFLFNGALDNVLAVYFGAVGFYPKLSVNAFNGWFLLQALSAQLFNRELLDTARVVGPITLRWVGLGLLGGYTALLLWLLWPQLKPSRPIVAETAPDRAWLTPAARLLVFFAAGLLVFGFFSLATEMHERYGLPALAFLALPAARYRRVLLPYLLLTAVWSFNLLRMLPWGPGVFNLIQSIPGDRLLMSLASVTLFIWLTLLYLGVARKQPWAMQAGPAPSGNRDA